MKKPTIIYISGYGRSGSTLLSLLLNVVPNFANVGEIDYLFREGDDELPKFWKKLRKDILEETSVPKMAKTKLSSIANYFRKRKESNTAFTKLWAPTLDVVTENFGASSLIDASKSTFGSFARPIYLKNAGYPTKVIHLIRSPHGVVASYRKGQNLSNSEVLAPAKMGGALRGLINWFVTNTSTSLVYKKKIAREEYYVLSYDKLICDYKNEMIKLFDFLQVSLPEVLLMEEILLSPDPSFSGNRLRLNKSLIIKKNETLRIKGFIGLLVSFFHYLYKKIEPEYEDQF